MISYSALACCIVCLLFFLIWYLFFLEQGLRKKIIYFNWPIVGMLPCLLLNLHRLHEFCIEIMVASGQCTTLFKGPWFSGMDFIITCNPDNINHIYSINFPNYHKGDAFVEIFDVLGDGIFNANSESWRFQRKMSHRIFSSQKSFMVEATCNKVQKVLLPFLNQAASNLQRIDLHEVFMRFTFDLTCINVFGVDLCYLAMDFPHIPFPVALHDIEEVLLYRHTVPRMWWNLLRWLNLGEEKKMSEAREVIDCFFAQVIADKREAMTMNQDRQIDEGHDDLLTLYMSHISEIDDTLFPSSDKFLRDTMLTLMGAGTSTTGVALAWFFCAVSLNPRVEAKILDELREQACEKTRSDSSCMTTFDLEDIEDLVYLHASVCESLRLFAPVPFNHKEAIEQDTLPTGHKIHPGCTIIIPTYSMGRMKEVWGEDCREFKPERWITEQGKIRHEPSYKFTTFASGPRTCVGKNMAMTQMKLVVASVIYNFKVQMVDDNMAEPTVSIILEMKDGLKVHLIKRGTE